MDSDHYIVPWNTLLQNTEYFTTLPWNTFMYYLNILGYNIREYLTPLPWNTLLHYLVMPGYFTLIHTLLYYHGIPGKKNNTLLYYFGIPDYIILTYLATLPCNSWLLYLEIPWSITWEHLTTLSWNTWQQYHAILLWNTWLHFLWIPCYNKLEYLAAWPIILGLIILILRNVCQRIEPMHTCWSHDYRL